MKFKITFLESKMTISTRVRKKHLIRKNKHFGKS